MKVNGEDFALAKPVDLLSFLQERGYDVSRIAVERNGVIVPRTQYAACRLSAQDKLEIVRFVGGG